MLQKLAMLRNRARRQQVKTMKTRTLNSPSVMVLITKRLKVRVKQQHTCTAPSNMHAVQQNQKQRQKSRKPGTCHASSRKKHRRGPPSAFRPASSPGPGLFERSSALRKTITVLPQTARARLWALAPYQGRQRTRATTRQQRGGFAGTLWARHP